MRVAMVSEHASPLAALGGADAGGQNVHVSALARELGAAGHEVVVHTRRDDPDLPETTELAPQVWVHHLDAGPPEPVPKDALLSWVPDMAAGVDRFWRDWRPDIAHAHFWMSGLATLPPARGHGVPVTQTFHALGSVKRRHQGLADTSPRSRLAEERRIALEVDQVIATCTDEVSELARMGLPPSRASVVPCGVDLSAFGPKGPVERRRAGVMRLLSIGRLVPRKGVDDVIRALRGLPDTELVVAGGPQAAGLGDDEEVARLRAEAAEHGVAERVTFLGSVARGRVGPLIRSADAVVCYPWYEPFGIVPLEAMACGVPVVASDVGGMRDTVRHGVTGLRVPPRSPDDLAEALRGLLASPFDRRRMGEAGALRARQRYAWPRVADATAQVYARTLRSAAQRRVG